MEFPREEHWSGLSFPSPGDLPDSGIELGSSALQADSLPAELSGKPTESSDLNPIFAFLNDVIFRVTNELGKRTL